MTERILIERIVALQWELAKLDARVEDEGIAGLSGHALRARLAAENRLRLDLQTLGLRPPDAAKPPSLQDYLER